MAYYQFSTVHHVTNTGVCVCTCTLSFDFIELFLVLLLLLVAAHFEISYKVDIIGRAADLENDNIIHIKRTC